MGWGVGMEVLKAKWKGEEEGVSRAGVGVSFLDHVQIKLRLVAPNAGVH